MSDSIQFVRNHQDLSTDKGYQFKFFCDHCGNGHMSAFEPSMLGMATGILSAASSIFGGVFGRASQGAYEVQRAVGGAAHDAALKKAVEELKQKFKQCTRCGKWVCPEVCWNAQRNLCEGCAPDLAEETAAAQAQAQRDQVFQKAREAKLVEDVDIHQEAVALCHSCGAKVGAAKFCPECGKPTSAKVKCAQCGKEGPASAKFCGDCGAPRAA